MKPFKILQTETENDTNAKYGLKDEHWIEEIYVISISIFKIKDLHNSIKL